MYVLLLSNHIWIKENKILKFCENQLLLFERCSNFTYPSKVFQVNNNSEYMTFEKEYYC